MVNKGTVVVRAEFGFQRTRAGGNAAVPAGDDGVCLTTVTGPWDRKREESAVKRIPDLGVAAETRTEPAPPPAPLTTVLFSIYLSLTLIDILILYKFFIFYSLQILLSQALKQ